jgi:hypothetical protein
MSPFAEPLCTCDIPKARRGNAVRARFIFLNLLKFDANFVAKLLLGHTNHPATLTNALTNMYVYRVLH